MALLSFIAVALTHVMPTSAMAGDGISAREIFQHASYLASGELEGRQAGHRGAELAALYIAQQLTTYGYEHLGETWELPFYVRGGATDGFGRIIIGTATLEAPNLVQVPTYSPVGVVRAPVTTATSPDLTGKIVALDTQADPDERQRAADLMNRGAAGVVFLRDESSLNPTAPAYSIKFSSEKTVEELLPKLDDETRRQVLESVRLKAPVVAISSNLRDMVLKWAAGGHDLTIDVRRLGRDESTNVAGILTGADPKLRNEYVIVCGHYDHIGTANGGEIYYGADDNASGTAAVLEIAEAVATMERRPRRSIVVIAWGAEELQMIGSKAFCRNPPISLQNIAAVINLDMVGRNDPEMVQVLAASDDLRRIAVDAAKRHGFTKTDGGNPIYVTATDTGSFVKRRVPSVSFHTGLHPDYNTPRDTVDRLDIDKITRIARTAFEVAVEVANADQRPAFTVIDPNLHAD